MKKNKAFTLAEVLITLGIIGVVAAMTLPALINKTKNKELHTAFLKTYAELNQVAMSFKADYGISVPEYTMNSSGIIRDSSKKIIAYYKGAKSVNYGQGGVNDGDGNYIAFYPMSTLSGNSYSGGANSNGQNSSFMCDNSAFTSTQSGALMIFNDAPRVEGQNGPVICVDINGKKKPNRYGIDYFMFIFTTDGHVIPVGQKHKNNPPVCNSSNGTCSNFNSVGSGYCSNTSNDISKNTSCAYYALTNTHPTKEGKDYWTDFLGEVYSR